MLGDLARALEECGYTMPNKELSRCQKIVASSNMVLGVEFWLNFPSTDVLFGVDKPSVYVNTPLHEYYADQKR